MDEQLNKEREEAYAARVKYDAAARELTAVEDELARYEAELSGCVTVSVSMMPCCRKRLLL